MEQSPLYTTNHEAFRLSQTRFPRGVLFDLDGTLLDSAPDMIAAINLMRAARDEPPMSLDALPPECRQVLVSR